MTVGEKIERGYGGGVFVEGKLERMKGGGEIVGEIIARFLVFHVT